jgi:hypothetical protein
MVNVMSKQNEPMTKDALADRLRGVAKDEDGRRIGLVSFADALAYGDERCETGLTAAAKVMCGYCFDGHYHKARLGEDGDWIHRDTDRDAGPDDYVTCDAGPIHDLLRRREEGKL